ncbi:MAG: tetratricopeptide repeat protein [Brevinematia bacterium]
MKKNLFSLIILLALSTLGYSKSLYSVYISEGMSFYKLENYEEAIKNFKQALDLNPNDPLPHRMIGLCYYKIQKLDDAIKYLSTSLTLEKSDNPITLSIIGNIYFRQNKYYNATLVYEKLSEITNSAFISYRLMTLCEKLNKLEESVNVGEKFLSNPTWEDFNKQIFISKLRSLYVKLGNKYKNQGEKQKANFYFEKAKKLN